MDPTQRPAAGEKLPTIQMAFDKIIGNKKYWFQNLSVENKFIGTMAAFNLHFEEIREDEYFD